MKFCSHCGRENADSMNCCWMCGASEFAAVAPGPSAQSAGYQRPVPGSKQAPLKRGSAAVEQGLSGCGSRKCSCGGTLWPVHTAYLISRSIFGTRTGDVVVTLECSRCPKTIEIPEPKMTVAA